MLKLEFNIWLGKDRAGRPRQRAGGGGVQRWQFSKILRRDGLHGSCPRDEEAAGKRMNAAWETYRREAGDPIAMAEAKKACCCVLYVSIRR